VIRRLTEKYPTNAWNTILSPAEVISASEREREREKVFGRIERGEGQAS
jgi:hypothetical protein